MTVGSVAVHPGEKWELCQGSRYRGSCIVFDKDETSLGRMISIPHAR